MTDRQTHVSVIVPIYNVEQTLKRCIESVLSQTFKSYEIILVDDGSTDSCGIICDEYEKKHENITVIHQENRGVSSARNAGIKVAGGEYLMFLDSDDYLAENCLETLTSKKVDLAIGTIVRRFANGYQIFQTDRADEIISNEQYGDYLPELLKENRLNFLHAKLFSRRIITRNQMTFEDYNLTYSEDTVFIFTFLKKCKSIFISGEIVYYYLPNSFGLGRIFQPDRYIKNRKLSFFLEDVCKEMNIYNSRMKEEIDKRRVQSAIWNIESIICNTTINKKQKEELLDYIKNDEVLMPLVDTIKIDNNEDLIRLKNKGSRKLLFNYEKSRFCKKWRSRISALVPKFIKKPIKNLLRK